MKKIQTSMIIMMLFLLPVCKGGNYSSKHNRNKAKIKTIDEASSKTIFFEKRSSSIKRII